jgi:hypothetical protein
MFCPKSCYTIERIQGPLRRTHGQSPSRERPTQGRSQEASDAEPDQAPQEVSQPRRPRASSPPAWSGRDGFEHDYNSPRRARASTGLSSWVEGYSNGQAVGPARAPGVEGDRGQPCSRKPSGKADGSSPPRPPDRFWGGTKGSRAGLAGRSRSPWLPSVPTETISSIARESPVFY